VNTNTVGQFTVFNGISNQVVQSTETTVSQTGEILCRVLIPAKYKTITKQVVVTPARTVERQIPAVTKQITKRVVDRQATTREIPVPAQTQTLTRRVVKTPARVVENGTGASFNTGRISGFVDANRDGRDDRDGRSRSAAGSADAANASYLLSLRWKHVAALKRRRQQ